MSDPLRDVAIIGAGLGGCALALALSQRNIPLYIYESRPPNAEVIASGVILTPNGLRILDRLGVFSRIKDRCYIPTHRVFKDRNDETTRKSKTSGESLYGYENHRIWRSLLLDEMKRMLAERGVKITYNAKFNGILSDSDHAVTFRINNDLHAASLLIGMDGIYSTVRRDIAPDVIPEYTGTVGVLSHIKTASVNWPYEDYERNATIQDKPGAIFFIAEDPGAEDLMIGLQKQSPEYSREELEKLQEDKERLVQFYRERYEEWGPTARSIIDAVTEKKEECFIWPFLRVPTLPRWYSETGRVVLCGDAAHGLPPSSGQGVNQALEDVYSLTLLLAAVGEGGGKKDGVNGAATNGERGNDVTLLEALAYWNEMRQERIDAVFDWATNSTNVHRMSEDERRKLIAEGKIKEPKLNNIDDMSWLYRPGLEDEVNGWIAGRARAGHSGR